MSEAGARIDYREAFARNLGLVSEAEQQRLRDSRVALAGLGGVGGAHLLALARLGIGGFALADFDRFETANLNRQAGAFGSTLGRPKLEVMAEIARDINPDVRLRLFADGIHEGNVDAFLEGAVAAVDGLDFFNMRARRLLFDRARRLGIPALTSGPVGFGATLHVFMPDGMSFDEYFDLSDEMSEAEQVLHFGLGLAPRLLHLRYFRPSLLDLSGRRAPSLGPACLLCAGLVATEIANLVLRRRPVRAAPYFFQFDPLVQAYTIGRLRWGNRGLGQRLKRWWVLRRNPSLRPAAAAAARAPQLPA